MVITVNVIPVTAYVNTGNPVGAIIKATTSKKMHTPNVLFILSEKEYEAKLLSNPMYIMLTMAKYRTYVKCECD